MFGKERHWQRSSLPNSGFWSNLSLQNKITNKLPDLVRTECNRTSPTSYSLHKLNTLPHANKHLDAFSLTDPPSISYCSWWNMLLSRLQWVDYLMFFAVCRCVMMVGTFYQNWQIWNKGIDLTTEIVQTYCVSMIYYKA